MQKIENVYLAFCCAQKLDRQLNCKSCSKTIIDFRDKSARFLQDQLASSDQSVCGIFNTSQLNHYFIRYSAATLFATGIVNLISCSPEMNDVEPRIQAATEIEIEVPFTGIIVEVMAEPIGGYEKFQRAIQSQLRLPADLSEKGRCFIEIVISSTGEIAAVKLLKGFNPLADQEAVRVMSSLKFPFKPAEQGGKRFDQKLIVLIIFDPSKKE